VEMAGRLAANGPGLEGQLVEQQSTGPRHHHCIQLPTGEQRHRAVQRNAGQGLQQGGGGGVDGADRHPQQGSRAAPRALAATEQHTPDRQHHPDHRGRRRRYPIGWLIAHRLMGGARQQQKPGQAQGQQQRPADLPVAGVAAGALTQDQREQQSADQQRLHHRQRPQVQRHKLQRQPHHVGDDAPNHKGWASVVATNRPTDRRCRSCALGT